MRDAGVIDSNFALFSIAMAIENIVDERIMKKNSPALERLSSQMNEIMQAHGLSKDQYWKKGDAPAEYEALSVEWDRVHDLLHAAAFNEYGEPEIAAMFIDRRAEFDAMRERGRVQVFGGKTPPSVQF
jgi:hypothetical protein